MGIKGMHKYAKLEIPNSHRSVDMLDALRKYKEKTQTSPTLIICLQTIISRIYEVDNPDIYLGSRYNVMREKFHNFLMQLKEAADTKFIFPVNIYNMYSNPSLGQTRDYNDGIEVMETIDQIKNVSDIVSHYAKQKECNEFYAPLPIKWETINILMDVAKNFGKIIKLHAEYYYKLEFMRLARKHNAIAIVAFDSDYIIVEPDSKWKYWSTNDIDFENLVTEEFDKEIVLQHFGLPIEKFELFWILAQAFGDFLYEEPIGYHIRKYFYPKKFFFINIANLVQYEELPTTEISLMEICKRIFPRKLSETKRFWEKLVNIFKVFTRNEDQFPLIYDEWLKSKDDPKICIYRSSLSSFVLHIDSLYSDLRKTDLQSISELAIPIYSKAFGIYFKSREGDTDEKYYIEFYCKKTHEEKYDVFEVETIAPSFDVPEFQKLLLGDLTDSQVLQILLYVTDLKFEEDQLITISNDKLLKLITLIYLMKNKSLRMNEAIAILKTLRDAKIDSDITHPEVANLRAFRVANLLFTFFVTIKRCLFEIGFKNYPFDMYMDGVYYQNLIANEFGNEEGPEFNNENDCLNSLIQFA